MKAEELIAEYLNSARAQGHDILRLTAHRRSNPKNWDRVRVLVGKPSLMGRCLGPTGSWPGQYLFAVRVEDAQAWLDARRALPCLLRKSGASVDV